MQLVPRLQAIAASGRSAAAIVAVACSLFAAPALSLDVELRDFAPDRVERQRAYARGEMPLPATPDLKGLDARLAAKGLARGRPIFIRIFKATSELEVWMQKGERFVLLDTYPICHWTGTLGPKLREGDRQSPEGFYSVIHRQMRLVGRWQKAFNLGFPNPHDQHNKRTGSFILVHGGCSSVGCFAMTEQVQEEIFALAEAAVMGGQQRFHVHVFPFRMTSQAMQLFENHPWAPFWRELKAGYDSFERTSIPPRVGLCDQRYHVTDGEPGEIGDARSLSQLPRQGGACTPWETERVASQTMAAANASKSTVEIERGTRRRPQSRNQSFATQGGRASRNNRHFEPAGIDDNSSDNGKPATVEFPNGFGEGANKARQLAIGG